MASQGFWSYVHADDKADGERISLLARHVVEQYEMLTGEKIELFLDKDAIKWGENWRDKIDENLASVAFFIPVLTPRYFMSSECRRELQFFARKAIQLGFKELILPVLYVDIQVLHDEEATDDIIQLIRKFQWEDWQELRFEETNSYKYRSGVARLASRLVTANRKAEERSAILPLPVVEEEILKLDIDDSPGFLDLLAVAEEAMPKWLETLDELRENIDQIGRIMQEGTEDINRRKSQAKGFAARLIVARHIAEQLGEPIETIWSLSNEFTSQLHDVDEGYRVIIDRAPMEIKNNIDAKEEICNMFEAIRRLNASGHYAIENTQKMIDAIGPIEKMSRDLRPAMRRLRQGLTKIVESRDVMDEWVELIKSSGVDCEDAKTKSTIIPNE